MTIREPRYSEEIRYLLDLVAFSVSKMDHEALIHVYSVEPTLMEDLGYRIGKHQAIAVTEEEKSTATATIHLMTWEQGIGLGDLTNKDWVIVAFRNRFSVKSIKYGAHSTLSLFRVVKILQRQGLHVESWGVYAPPHLMWYQLAMWADRLKRYDIGFYLRDRGALSPVTASFWKTWSNFGVVVGWREKACR